MKRIMLALILILMCSFVIAETNKVYIVDFKYQDGKVLFNDKVVKYGFSPDRKLETGDYTGKIISLENRELYNLKFSVPLIEFVDISNTTTGELSGGIVRYNETEFAIVLPYFDEAKEIQIFNPQQEKVLVVDVSEVRKEGADYKKDYGWLYFLLALLVIIVILFVFRRRKRSTKTI